MVSYIRLSYLIDNPLINRFQYLNLSSQICEIEKNLSESENEFQPLQDNPIQLQATPLKRVSKEHSNEIQGHESNNEITPDEVINNSHRIYYRYCALIRHSRLIITEIPRYIIGDLIIIDNFSITIANHSFNIPLIIICTVVDLEYDQCSLYITIRLLESLKEFSDNGITLESPLSNEHLIETPEFHKKLFLDSKEEYQNKSTEFNTIIYHWEIESETGNFPHFVLNTVSEWSRKVIEEFQNE